MSPARRPAHHAAHRRSRAPAPGARRRRGRAAANDRLRGRGPGRPGRRPRARRGGRAGRAGPPAGPLRPAAGPHPRAPGPVRHAARGAGPRSLRDSSQQARAGLQPDEIALALVRRLGRALGLAHCAFVRDPAGRGRGPGDRRPLGRAIRARAARPRPLSRDRRGGPEPPRPRHAGHARGRLGRRPHDGDAGGGGRRGRRRAADARARVGAPGSARPSSAWPEAWPRRRRARSMPARPAQRRAARPPPAGARPPAAGGARARPSLFPELQPGPARRRGRVPARRGRSRGRGAPAAGARRPDPAASSGCPISSPATAATSWRWCCPRPAPTAPGAGSCGSASGWTAWPPASSAYPHPSVTVPDDLLALVEAALRRGRAQAGERIGVAE